MAEQLNAAEGAGGDSAQILDGSVRGYPMKDGMFLHSMNTPGVYINTPDVNIHGDNFHTPGVTFAVPELEAPTSFLRFGVEPSLQALLPSPRSSRMLSSAISRRQALT